MTTPFDTIRYEASHGRKPRGNGGWAFGFNSRNPAIDDVYFAPHGSYAAAKKAAREEALRRYPHASSITIYPLP